MRFLFVSTLYPSSTEPTRATYSRSLLLAVRALGHEVRVIAPKPWFPVIDRLLRHRALPPLHEEIDGIPVAHPRFLNIPGLRTWKNHLWYRRAVMPMLKRVIREWTPDHVSVGFAYPDGAAIIPVTDQIVEADQIVEIDQADEGVRNEQRTKNEAQRTKNEKRRTTNQEQSSRPQTSGCITDPHDPPPQPSPFTLRASAFSLQVLGSDFRLRTRQPRFRDIVMDTLHKAPLIFCPGQALKRDMIDAGIEADKIVPFNNGVNRDIFYVDEAVEKIDIDQTVEPEQSVQPHYVRDAHHVRTSTESTDFDVFDDFDGFDEPRVVLFVGNLVPVKGVDRLLKAFKVVQGSCLHGNGKLEACPTLHIIGSGPEEKRLRKLAHDLGIADSVQFLGRKSQEEVAAAMREAHCLCLPSRSEGMPNVVLEALACGTPVVATAVGENPYLIEDGVNGHLVSHEIHENSRTFEVQLVKELHQCLIDTLSASWEPSEVARTVNDMTWRLAAKVFINACS